MVDATQMLANLSTRPPTPPKGRPKPPTDGTSPNGYPRPASHPMLLDTPNESPSSSAEYSAASLLKGTKRVEFSPYTSFHKPLSIEGKELIAKGNIRPLPPSRDCKSLRSILKTSTEPFSSSPAGDRPQIDGSNFSTMLDSVLAHLRSSCRTSRLDAYCALRCSLAAYDEFPDTQILVDRMPELVEHIRRDICAMTGEKATLDTQLATQSLKLLTSFLFSSILAESLPDEFCTYILEKAIWSLEDADLPKTVVTHYMQVVAKQNFTGKYMTSERATRIMLLMKGLTDRVKGNSIINLRLRIYGRLLTQAKCAFNSSARDWIDHLVSGMLSTTKEIRSLAVTFGLDAGITLGTTSSVSQACYEMFNRKSDDGRTVMDFLAGRLNDMIRSKDDILSVPQIWSVLTLLLRNRRHQLERWLHLKPWLLVIQKCLNSNDARVKCLAMTAWNRLVMAIDLDSSTSQSMIKMLRQPVVSHLNRKGGDKFSKQTRQLAHSSYCILLLYAFRPSATSAQLDLYWEHYVEQVLPESFSASERDTNQACAILAALCHSSQTRLWEENRANVDKFTKPEELPCIDPKWIRSRAAKIIAVFEKLVSLADWDSQGKAKQPIVLAWQCFTAALGEAGRQEVKTSIESMSAVAQILNMIRRFWDRAYVQSQTMSASEFSNIIGKLRCMIREAIANIGTITFNEQRLLQSSANCFEAAETPSSRSIRHQETLSSPIIHVLRLLLSTLKDADVTEDSTCFLRYLLDVALHSTSSRVSQLALLREMVSLIVVEVPDRTTARVAFWQLISEATRTVITKPRPRHATVESPQPAGREYRDVTKVLEAGIYQHSTSTFDVWQDLMSATCESLRDVIGDGGIALVITEPLSAAVNHKLESGHDEFLLGCATSLLQTAEWSRSAQTVNRAKASLWGLPTSNQRPSAPPHFDQLYKAVDRVLGMVYAGCLRTDSNAICAVLEALTRGLNTCPLDHRVGVLQGVQRGIACWIEDADSILATHSSECIYSAIRNLWMASQSAIEQMEYTTTTLRSVQDILTSSLRSRHRSIVNDAIIFWNRSFGKATQLEYPDALRSVLARLRSVTELDLPGFPEVEDIDITSSPFNFVESQDSEVEEELLPTSSPQRSHDIVALIHTAPTGNEVFHRSRFPDSSPKVKLPQQSTRKRISRTPQRTRLRHDDSQIQFSAIEGSSPLASEMLLPQILTNHQRETKERQSHEIALFPELASSPQSSSRPIEPTLPRLDLSGSKHQYQLDMDPDAQVSPMYPVIDDTMENFLGSSPTPRSGKKFISNAVRATSPSLLPLSVTYRPDGGKPTTPVAVDSLKASHNEELEDETKQQTHILNSQNDPIVSDVRQQSHPNTTNQISHATSPKAASNANITHVRSEVDMFVDPATESLNRDRAADDAVLPNLELRPEERQALTQCPHAIRTSQISSTPPRKNDEPTTWVNESFHSQSSFYSNDDEQISAQLAADIETAHSQAELVCSQKKRKRTRPDANRTRKKLRNAGRSQFCQVVVESCRPREFDEECILVDTRMAIESPDRASSRIKRERTSSPSGIPYHSTTLPIMEVAGNPSLDSRTSAELGGPTQKPNASKGTQASTEQRLPRRRSARLNEMPERSEGPHESCRNGEVASENIRSSAATRRASQGEDHEDNISTPQPDVEAPNQPGDGLWRTIDNCIDDSSGGPHAEVPLEASKPSLLLQCSQSIENESSSSHKHRGEAPAKAVPTGINGSNQPQPQTNSSNQIVGSDLGQAKTGIGLLQGFKQLLADIKQVKLGAEDERSMVTVLFECVKEVQEAGRRHSSG